MDFFRQHGAVINVPDSVITFRNNSRALADCSEPRHTSRSEPLRLTDDDVVVPPRSCTLVLVAGDEPFGGDVIDDQISSLIFSHGISVARGLVTATAGRTNLLLTNFRAQHRHLPKDTAVAYFDNTAEIEGSLSALDKAPQEESVPNLGVGTTLSRDE